MNDELLNITWILQGFSNVSHVLRMNMLTTPLLVGYMESAVGPMGASVKKEKGKKTAKAPNGKEDKDQMRYKFQGVEINMKVTTEWDTVSDTNLGHIDIDGFRQ